MRIHQQPALLLVPRQFGDDAHGVDGAAGNAAAEVGDHHRRLTEGAGVVRLHLPVQLVNTQIGRNGVVAARVHNARAGAGSEFVVLVDGPAYERHLAGQIDVVGAGVGHRGDQRFAVLEVRTDGRGDDAGARGHRIQRRGRVGVGDDERPVLRRWWQLCADLLEFGLAATRERDARPGRSMLGEIASGQFAGKAGCAEDDDIEFACGVTHGPSLLPNDRHANPPGGVVQSARSTTTGA